MSCYNCLHWFCTLNIRENKNRPTVKYVYVKWWIHSFEHDNLYKMTCFTVIMLSHSTSWKSKRAAQFNHLIPLQVSQTPNLEVIRIGRWTRYFIAEKSSFFGFKTPQGSIYRNEQGSTSNTVSSNKLSSIDCISNSFLIYVPPPDNHHINTSSLWAAKFSMFSWVFCFGSKRSWALVIETCIYCRVNWPRCKCSFYTFWY